MSVVNALSGPSYLDYPARGQNQFSSTFKHKTFLRRFVIFAQIVYRCVAMLPEQVLKWELLLDKPI